MKVRKSTFFNKVKSEYGQFEILADKGCEVYTFIDYISKLLVVRESTDEQRKSGKPYLPKMYILNPKNGDQIEREHYEKYFNYNPIVQKSNDNKWEVSIHRKIDKNGTDFIEEWIKNLETGEELNPAQGVAFRQSKYESWIDRYHEEIERRKTLEAKLTLDQHFRKCINELEENDSILKFISSKVIYHLIYTGKTFQLKSKEGNLEREYNWGSVTHIEKEFDSVENFWEYIIKDKYWFKNLTPVREKFGIDKLMAKSIIEFHNSYVKGEFKTGDYRILHKWMNSVFTDSIKRSEYKQYCSNCGKSVFHNARYPKYVCGDCTELIVDSKGRQVEFFNTEMLGHGCQGYYIGTEQKEKYNSNKCFIEEKEFYAEEAHFGGIVIQLKE